jgi:hypothetical protein
MKINRGSKSFYYGDSEENPSAEMSYVLTGEKLMIIDHTYVSEELKGQGVGNRLLNEVVDWARNEGRKIMPLCPFAKAQMEKHASFHDMIHR